jgi:hypothetical protein
LGSCEVGFRKPIMVMNNNYYNVIMPLFSSENPRARLRGGSTPLQGNAQE